MNSRPIIKGDRVSHYFHGEGTVDAIDENYKPSSFAFDREGGIKICRVQWDNHSVTWEPEMLLNLINGQMPSSES